MAKDKDLKAAAKAFSKLGAAKGGKARANVLTPAERSSIARQAVQARWVKAGKLKATDNAAAEGGQTINGPPVVLDPIPFSMFRGALKMGDIELGCHVLNDGRRVLTQGEIVRVLTGGRDSSDLQRYLRNNPLFPAGFGGGQTLQFRVPGNPQIATGCEGALLIEICQHYLDARQQKLLRKNQLHLAAQAEIVVRACAKVGIIALIDEATGYQQVRQKRALQLKLQAFIAEELQEWAKMFPDEFWIELARLEGIHYSPRSRPLRWGKYVMMFVYDAIDTDVGKELRKKNPNPHFLQNHHQWLQKFGRQQVHDQITGVVAIMRVCADMEDFRHKFARAFKKNESQMELGFMWTD